MSSVKKQTALQKAEKAELKKKRKRKKAIITAVISVVIIACIVVGSIILTRFLSRANQLYEVEWVPVSARNSEGKDVDVNEIYDVYYSNYSGHLTFEKDGTFQLWINPGDPDDGTHGGTFTIKDDIITADFDEGTETEFIITRGDDGYIENIEIGYDEYRVFFEPGEKK